MELQVDIARREIEHLARSDRGRRVLALLQQLHVENTGLDAANTRAVDDIVMVMTSHQINGTLADLLAPYKA